MADLSPAVPTTKIAHARKHVRRGQVPKGVHAVVSNDSVKDKQVRLAPAKVGRGACHTAWNCSRVCTCS